MVCVVIEAVVEVEVVVGGVGKERVRDVRSGFEREILRVGCACGVGVEISEGSVGWALGVRSLWSGMSWSCVRAGSSCFASWDCVGLGCLVSGRSGMSSSWVDSRLS